MRRIVSKNTFVSSGLHCSVFRLVFVGRVDFLVSRGILIAPHKVWVVKEVGSYVEFYTVLLFSTLREVGVISNVVVAN
jgi:hypothetical protein